MTSSFSFEIQGSSSAMAAIRKQIERIAKVDSTVLIYDDAGTSKEAVARMIHQLSQRRAGPFLCLDCRAFIDRLNQSDLVGHEKDTFGEMKERPNEFLEQVDGGTLFLDGVETLTMKAQGDLLRFLEPLENRRMGSGRGMPIDVRLIASSSADLQALTAKRQFRQDLLYRLNVLSLRIPVAPDRKDAVR